jgi:opacity protein-like surface antigen
VTRSIYFLAEWSFFWRESTNDAIYSPSLLTTPVNSGITGYIEFPDVNRQRYVGNQLGLGTQFNLNQHLTYTVGYNYLTVGSFLKDTPPGFPPGKNVGYFVMWFTYRF